MIDPELGELSALSRVELEPVLVRIVRRCEVADAERVATIRAELASRTWQNINPYAPKVTEPGK